MVVFLVGYTAHKYCAANAHTLRGARTYVFAHTSRTYVLAHVFQPSTCAADYILAHWGTIKATRSARSRQAQCVINVLPACPPYLPRSSLYLTPRTYASHIRPAHTSSPTSSSPAHTLLGNYLLAHPMPLREHPRSNKINQGSTGDHQPQDTKYTQHIRQKPWL